jgi:hypothetical protein
MSHIHKYISFEQFIDLIESSRLYFTRITKWDDPYEGHYTDKSLYEDVIKEMNSNKMSAKFVSDIEGRLLPYIFRHFCYAQSWCKDDNESDAMWRIYSSKKGVKITVDKEIITNSIKQEFENKYKIDNILDIEVNYTDKKLTRLKNFNPNVIVSNLLTNKRKAFIHENEIRLGFLYPPSNSETYSTYESTKKSFLADIKKAKNERAANHISMIYLKVLINQVASSKEEKLPNVIHYKFPLNALIKVTLDPNAPKYLEETFINYCRNNRFPKKDIIFTKSKLYSIV